jgi:hypothetical protein
MNRVCKDGKLYGYNVANGKLFDLATYETIETKKVEEVKKVEKEMVEEKAAKVATKFRVKK